MGVTKWSRRERSICLLALCTWAGIVPNTPAAGLHKDTSDVMSIRLCFRNHSELKTMHKSTTFFAQPTTRLLIMKAEGSRILHDPSSFMIPADTSWSFLTSSRFFHKVVFAKIKNTICIQIRLKAKNSRKWKEDNIINAKMCESTCRKMQFCCTVIDCIFPCPSWKVLNLWTVIHNSLWVTIHLGSQSLVPASQLLIQNSKLNPKPVCSAMASSNLHNYGKSYSFKFIQSIKPICLAMASFKLHSYGMSY